MTFFELPCIGNYLFRTIHACFYFIVLFTRKHKKQLEIKTKVGLLGVFLVSSEFALYYYYYYYYYIYFVKAFNVYCDLHTNNKCKTLADKVWRGNHKP